MTTMDDLFRTALRGVPSDAQRIRLGCLEREVLDWLNGRPRFLDCDREQLRIDHATQKRVVDRMIKKQLIKENVDKSDGNLQLWMTPRGLAAHLRIPVVT